MAARTISRDALQELLLEKLKAMPGCSGAQSIVIDKQTAAGAPSNWQVGVFDSGTSPTETCRKALAGIESCLASVYEVHETGGGS